MLDNLMVVQEEMLSHFEKRKKMESKIDINVFGSRFLSINRSFCCEELPNFLRP